MHLIEITYILAAVIALSAGIPQLRQLLLTKASDEFSLSTWLIWLMTQCITLVYVIKIGDTVMTFVNIAWVMLYAAMVGLIIYYRHVKRVLRTVCSEDDVT